MHISNVWPDIKLAPFLLLCMFNFTSKTLNTMFPDDELSCITNIPGVTTKLISLYSQPPDLCNYTDCTLLAHVLPTIFHSLILLDITRTVTEESGTHGSSRCACRNVTWSRDKPYKNRKTICWNLEIGHNHQYCKQHHVRGHGTNEETNLPNILFYNQVIKLPL